MFNVRFICLLILGTVAVGTWVLFNRLVRFRNRMREGWSGIEVQLKRRHDLIPQLVKCVEAFRDHERGTLTEVMEKRSAAQAAHGAAEAGVAEGRLASEMGRLLLVAEDYPELKADARFRELMIELVETENAIQYARRYYNGAVRELNNALETFPSNLVAGAFKFKAGQFFELGDRSEEAVPEVRMGS